MKRFYLLFVALLALLAAASAQHKFTTVECPGMHVLYIDAIDGNGTTLLAGYNTDADPVWHTLIIKHGKCTPLAPNTLLGTKFSIGYGMNERGDVVGNYSDGSYGSASHGYLLRKNGVLTTLDFPTADSTIAMGINASGTVVGQWQILDSVGNPVSIHGFTWKNGVFTDFAMPGAALTVLGGINAQGEYAGWQANDFLYLVQHGFIFARGRYTNFDVPSAVGTQIVSINDRGQIAGQYWGDDGYSHGYVKLGREVRIIDYPGAMMTGVQTVTNAGQVGGWYYNPDWTIHAFLAEMK